MKAILLDDENLAMVYLEHQLHKIADIQIVGKFDDPLKVMPFIRDEEVDVVFLDIQLPEMNGIELAEQMIAIKPGIQIVFVTAHDEYAIKAFELNAIDYVMKPVGFDRLSKTVHRLQERMKETPSAAQPLTDALIYINVFPHFCLKTRDGTIASLRWRTTKAQELFLYLLQHRLHYVRKASLIDMLWPDLDSEKAYSQLYTVVYHIRKTLEPYRGYFQLLNTNDGYMLSVENVCIDAEDWEKFIAAGLPVSGETILEYETYMELYKGDYLQDSDYLWLESERHRLKTLWLRAAFKMAEWYAASQKYDKSVEMYIEISTRYPHVEEAHFALMKLFASMDRHLSVHRQYQWLTSFLMKELNEEPSPYITEWYQTWKQEHKE